jgi:hypothetical protein
MGLKEKIQDNVVVLVAGAFVAGASMAWLVAEKVRVQPMEIEKTSLVARIERLEKHDIPHLLRSNPALLEPRRQCEIVQFYDRLSMAIEKGDRQQIEELYSESYRSVLGGKITVVSSYKRLFGKKVFFYVASVRHNDNGTVSVNVKAFYELGNHIDSNDTLVCIDNSWKFVH